RSFCIAARQGERMGVDAGRRPYAATPGPGCISRSARRSAARTPLRAGEFAVAMLFRLALGMWLAASTGERAPEPSSPGVSARSGLSRGGVSMGAIYRPTYRGKDGAMHQSGVWWVRFRQHGKTVRQSTEVTDERKARAILREKEGKVA